MQGLWIDILLFVMIYTLMIFLIRWRYELRHLIFLIRWRSSYRRPRNRNSDGEGGIPIDFNWEPDLDLPPGITLPDGGPGREKDDLEEEIRRVELV